VKRDHRRVRDLPHDASFLHKAIAGFAARELAREELDGDNARDEGIEGASDTAISAHSNHFQNFVTADLA
jgi:hypothetical protein